MLGLNLLVRLGRRVLAPVVADTGLLPAAVYRHLVLAALEEEDFPGALNYLPWALDPLLGQILVLRLRLLAAHHRRQYQALGELLENGLPVERRERCRALLNEESKALDLLGQYESKAMLILRGGLGEHRRDACGHRSPALP
jgi:hypothetical protein